MKCILFSTERIEFRRGSPSNRPRSIVPESAAGETGVYSDLVVAFLCIEDNDTDVDAGALADDICAYGTQLGRRVLLVPFVHLTSQPCLSPERRAQLWRIIEAHLKLQNLLHARLADGYDRALIARWETKDHKCGVAFRDSRHRSNLRERIP